MEFREARPDDAEAIRETAHTSLHVSYEEVLGEETIHDALDRWYEVTALEENIEGDDELYVVAAEDDDVVGFSQSLLRAQDGRVEWLHVHPDHRDRDVGSRLLEHTRDALAAHGAEGVVGVVLVANEAGNEFYEGHGFTLDGQRTVDIGGEFYTENRYLDVSGQEYDLEPVETPDGEMYVDRRDPDRGREGPFHTVYRSADGTRRWGHHCGNCGSVDTTMDTMERIVCNDCGNVRRAARWDAAYL